MRMKLPSKHMHRTCCRAANAYDPASAIRYAFAQVQLVSSTPRTNLPQPCGAISRPIATGIQARGRRQALRRPYSTGKQRPSEDSAEWAQIEETEKQRERLSLYDSALGPESRQPRRDGAFAGREDDDAHVEASSRGDNDTETATRNPSHRPRHEQGATSHETDHLHWRVHMAVLTQRAQDVRRDKTIDEATATRMLDYEANVIRPREPEGTRSTPLPWAISHDVRQTLSPMSVLNEEIKRFADSMVLSNAEKVARNSIVLILKALIRRTMGDGIKSWVYGSQRHGTAMPFSDIDIGVSDPRLQAPEELTERMEALYRHLNESKNFICVVSRGGRYPIITAQHKTSGIDVQVVAAEHSMKQLNAVKHYLATIPNMLPLYAIVRTTFGMRGFVDPFIGGLSAYGTFMMLAAALTRRGLPANAHSSPATQLLHFLSFWAAFDTTKQGLALHSTIPTAPFKKSREEDYPAKWTALANAANARKDGRRAAQYKIARLRAPQPYLLCLQDPAQASNDLGARCNAIKHITSTLKNLDKDLRQRMERGAHLFRRSESASLLVPLVGGCHEVYAERRRKVEGFGRESRKKHDKERKARKR